MMEAGIEPLIKMVKTEKIADPKTTRAPINSNRTANHRFELTDG